jgi:hypothetical protein
MRKSKWGVTYRLIDLREYVVFGEVRGGGDFDESRTRRSEDRRVGGRLFGGDSNGDGGDGGDIERYN